MSEERRESDKKLDQILGAIADLDKSIASLDKSVALIQADNITMKKQCGYHQDTLYSKEGLCDLVRKDHEHLEFVSKLAWGGIGASGTAVLGAVLKLILK